MQSIYLEQSDEITTVIERIKTSSDAEIALIVPKGAVLLQSIVNLKLARKAAADAGKELTLVTTDKVGRNLAAQVGIANLSHMDAAGEINSPTGVDAPEEPETIGGVRIHRYYDNDGQEEPVEPLSQSASPIAPIVPLAAEPIPSETEDLSPIVVRSIVTDAPVPKPKRPVVEIIQPNTTPAPAVKDAAAHMAIGASPVLESAPPQERRPKRRGPALFLAYLLVLVLIGVGAVSYFYLPATTVTIHVSGEAWSKNYPVSAVVNQSVDEATHLTTAQLLSTSPSLTATFKATGTKDIGDKATGTVTVTNFFDSNTQTLPAGAQITASGHTFITTAAVTVPGFQRIQGKDTPGQAQVAVVAQTEGSDSNISSSASAIISPQTNLSGGAISTTGGSSKVVAVITQTDIANAKDDATKKLQSQAKAELDAKMGGHNYISDSSKDSFSLTSTTSTPDAGTQADSGQITLKATSSRLVADADALQVQVRKVALKDVSPNTTRIITAVTSQDLSIDSKDQTITLTAVAKGKNTPTVPVDRIAQQLGGKTQQNGSDYIKSQVNDATIIVSQKPSWWPFHRFPSENRYLKVVATYE